MRASQTNDGSEEFLRRKRDLDEARRDRPAFIWYLPAVMVASLKDLLDLAIGWIPGVGFVLAVIFGVSIFLLLSLIKTNKSLLSSGFVIRRLLVMIFAILAESIPMFNLIPITTATVFVIYWIDKHASEKQIEILSKVLKKI